MIKIGNRWAPPAIPGRPEEDAEAIQTLPPVLASVDTERYRARIKPALECPANRAPVPDMQSGLEE